VADLKPAYLISGDDDARIDAWRSRLRKRAEEEGGAGSLETFDASTSDPDEVAASLNALTFAMGTRYVLADGVESWKAGDVEPLEAALAAIAPGTVLVLIARGKPPVARLVKAVEKAGGEVRQEQAPKPWELPKWAAERAREQGLELDVEAAKTLVSMTGPRQQRIVRELEKLALTLHPETSANAEQVRELAASDITHGAYDVADAVLARDGRRALELAEELSSQEAPGKLVWPIVTRLREVLRVAELLDTGVPQAKLGESTGMPTWRLKKTLAAAKSADRSQLERALCLFADLEVETRSGELDERTAFSRALARAAA
jgi:DNA polymerase-3 subunit delta